MIPGLDEPQFGDVLIEKMKASEALTYWHNMKRVASRRFVNEGRIEPDNLRLCQSCLMPEHEGDCELKDITFSFGLKKILGESVDADIQRSLGG